jgi:hypothetical protein
MTCPYCGTEMPTSALFCGECGRLLAGREPSVRLPVRSDTTVMPSLPLEIETDVENVEAESVAEPAPEPEQIAPGEDLDATVLGTALGRAQRFSLQFSTGENVTVFGSGLIGRNPRPEPQEFFDHLVSISDPGKSVSKTHLEFGAVDGEFWVSDRVSANGSAVQVADSELRRCDPGKRYFVDRGGRVTMGDQFFVVS